MRRLFVFLVLVTTAIQVHAQPESSGLLEALRVVPIQTFLSDADGTVTYSDVAAAFSARDMAVPRDWPSFQAQGNMFGVFAVLPPAFPDAITEWLTLAGEYPDTLGIDFFDITGTVEFGAPPSQALVLLGEFTPEQIAARFATRDYGASDMSNAGILLCPLDHCDTDAATNLIERDPGNPFGGALGRRQAALASSTFLLSSPSYQVVVGTGDLIRGAATPLSDLEDVRAIAAILAAHDHVLNVRLVNPLLLSVADPLRLVGNLVHPDAVRSQLEEMASQPLPPYSLAAYAATVDGGIEHGLVVLTYSDEEAALYAANSIEMRLNSLTSLRREVPYAVAWSDAGQLSFVSATQAQGTDLWAVVVQLSAPMSEPGSSIDFQNIRSGRPYLRLTDDLSRRDVLWLLPGR